MAIPGAYRVVQVRLNIFPLIQISFIVSSVATLQNCLIRYWIVRNELLLFQEIIKDQVADMYLWPKRLEVQIMDPAK